MYLNIFGGSGLLHLLAGHPRVVAVFGLAATVMMLTSPLGPGGHGAAARYAAAIDASIPPSSTAAVLQDANRSAERLMSASPEMIEHIVLQTLRQCGAQCGDVPASDILHDPVLLRKVIVLYEVNRRTAGRDGQFDASDVRTGGTR
jgi:hypothetical protein